MEGTVDITGAVLAVLAVPILAVVLFGALPIIEGHLNREDANTVGPAPRH
jgi:hypothetical protein